jgi:hypothetical protein
MRRSLLRIRRGHRPPLARVFLGCEGESERAYGAFLAMLVESAGLPFHINTVVLNPGAGDPLVLIGRAQKKIEEEERKRGAYKIKAVLMDIDRIAANQARRQQTQAIAIQNGIDIIWQNLCHETMLLHHLLGCQTQQPATSQIAQAMLRTHWPDYAKPMTRFELSQRLDRAAVTRAASVEPLLHNFLCKISLI